MKQLTMQVSPAAALPEQAVKKYQQQLLPEIERIAAAYQYGYDTQYASVNVPFDAELVRLVQSVVQDKQKKQISALIVIGIGGSSLGTKAVHEALHGVYYNERTVHTKLYF